jgi:carboxyl-terminal processing protease
MHRKDVIWTILIVTLVALGVQAFAAKKDDHEDQFLTLATVFEKVRENYVGEVDDKALFEGALRGALLSLDRYSAYISPEDLEEFRTQTKGEFQGLGIELGSRGGWLTVIAPIEDTPAWRAGIRAGDKITKIEGKTTQGMAVDQAVKVLRGKKGTSVNISVVHEGDRKETEVLITRDVIPLLSVRGYKRSGAEGRWDYLVDPVHKIGYVRISAFQENTQEDLDKAMDEMKAAGVRGVVLDLRFNPGGLLTTAVSVCDRFINEGVIVSVRGRTSEPVFYKAHKLGKYPDLPLAVLVNSWSASASEIVGGAIQDHHRGVLVGERSFGKGSVQNIFMIQDGKAALKLTTARYYTPAGRSIHREEGSEVGGLTPDILVETDVVAKVKIQQLWQKLGTPPKEVKKEEADVAPKAPAPVDEEELDVFPDDVTPTPKVVKDAPFVDEQLARAVDAVKALLIVREPAAPDATAATVEAKPLLPAAVK